MMKAIKRLFTRRQPHGWIQVIPEDVEAQEDMHPILELGASIRDIGRGVIQCSTPAIMSAVEEHLEATGTPWQRLGEYTPPPRVDLGRHFWDTFRQFNAPRGRLEYDRDLGKRRPR